MKKGGDWHYDDEVHGWCVTAGVLIMILFIFVGIQIVNALLR